MAHVAILCDHLAGKLSLLLQKIVYGVQLSRPGVNEKACPHVNIRTNFQHPSSYASNVLISSWFLFSLVFCLSVSDKSFDSRFLFNILSHTNILLRFLSLSLSLSFSVTLNVILYFTNLRPPTLLLLLLLNLSSVTLQCVLLFVSASFCFFPFSSSWIRPECVCECLICSLCWLLFVKHTFNSSILYCICFPFFLFVSISRAHARVCVLYLLEFSTNGALPPQIHARTCLPSRRVSIGGPNRCAIDVMGFITFVINRSQCSTGMFGMKYVR